MQNSDSLEMLALLRETAEGQQMPVSEEQAALFARYYQMLVEYNQKTNLTRILGPRDVAVKHFGDSIAVLSQEPIGTGLTVLDVGTGGGIPGIPLAIMRQDLQITLMDSLRKRTTILLEIVQRLGLNNVEVVWGRAEDLAHKRLYREMFDIVVARAVAPLNILVELCLPFVKPAGYFLAMKGPKAQEELALSGKAISKLGGGGATLSYIELPMDEGRRVLVKIPKKTTTNRSYPRRAGIPERNPLA